MSHQDLQFLHPSLPEIGLDQEVPTQSQLSLLFQCLSQKEPLFFI